MCPLFNSIGKTGILTYLYVRMNWSCADQDDDMYDNLDYREEWYWPRANMAMEQG